MTLHCLLLNSVTRQVNFKGTKNVEKWWKMPRSKTQMWHFWWFSNTVVLARVVLKTYFSYYGKINSDLKPRLYRGLSVLVSDPKLAWSPCKCRRKNCSTFFSQLHKLQLFHKIYETYESNSRMENVLEMYLWRGC